MSRDEEPKRQMDERPGTGALCPEAQADGVPCFERGRDCDICEHRASERGKAVGDFVRDLGKH